MIAKKVLFTAVTLSLIGHAVVLACSGIFLFSGSPPVEPPFMVDLCKPVTSSKKSLSRTSDQLIPKRELLVDKSAKPRIQGEDTVNLDSRNTPYQSYLVQIQKQINRVWVYPGDALARKEEGITLVKFSIDETGKNMHLFLVRSSGSEVLDKETLRAIQSAAPFAPLPREYNLSKLNIIAEFKYQLAN